MKYVYSNPSQPPTINHPLKGVKRMYQSPIIKQKMLYFITDDDKWDKYTHICNVILCIVDINACMLCMGYAYVHVFS